MKSLLLLLLVLVTTSCSTMPNGQFIQKALTTVLSPNFKGDYRLTHSNMANIGVDIQFYGLSKDATTGLWTWTGMDYAGHSPWTNTKAGAVAPKN
jgi:hypothetical protein